MQHFCLFFLLIKLFGYCNCALNIYSLNGGLSVRKRKFFCIIFCFVKQEFTFFFILVSLVCYMLLAKHRYYIAMVMFYLTSIYVNIYVFFFWLVFYNLFGWKSFRNLKKQNQGSSGVRQTRGNFHAASIKNIK